MSFIKTGDRQPIQKVEIKEAAQDQKPLATDGNKVIVAAQEPKKDSDSKEQ